MEDMFVILYPPGLVLELPIPSPQWKCSNIHTIEDAPAPWPLTIDPVEGI